MGNMQRNWINAINTERVEIYPIQFANCDRLVKNDAVYIFDEVGSGKTISSGLMALDYLVNHPDKNVLVITTNSLVKANVGGKGQFLTDWCEKLPFEAFGLVPRIKVVNNHCSNLRRERKLGLVIIDEAQLFLNQDSERHQNLIKNIRADKIVFLTATPIKNGKSDLAVYCKIAQEVLQKEVDCSWIEQINTLGKNKNELICSTFDVSSPVTRYFKDTIIALNREDSVENKARRLLPELWEYEGKDNWEISKMTVLLNKIEEAFNKNSNSRFIIFTRFVEKEAYRIKSFLCENGFSDFGTNNIGDEKTVKVITGENAYELTKYTGTEGLPRILILTYQIAEQGVNLPGFNYVINYHISAFPSALEQRFGRIDRMGKNKEGFEEIHMCFLLSNDYYDTNTMNFYHAVSIYLNNLVSYLPSKNTIISTEIIEQYKQAKHLTEEYVKGIMKLIDDRKQIVAIREYFIANDENKECKCSRDLFDFIIENKIEFDVSAQDAEELFLHDVKECLKEFQSSFSSLSEGKILECETIINKIGDQIFYKQQDEMDKLSYKLNMLNAVDDCGKNILNCDMYKKYKEKFNNEVKILLLIMCYRKEFNGYFEQNFKKNCMKKVFPIDGYSEVFKEIIETSQRQLNEEEKELILKHSNEIDKGLPFFRMCEKYKDIIQGYVYTKDGEYRNKFDFDPFVSSLSKLVNIAKESTDCLGLSKEFGEYLVGLNENLGSAFEIKEENLKIKASNWYKLAYKYLCRGEMVFARNSNLEEIQLLITRDEKNIYKILEQDVIQAYMEKDEILYKEMYDAMEKSVECIKNIESQSVFNHFLYTEKGEKRAYLGSYGSMIIDSRYLKGKKVDDIWTFGICYES